MKKAAKIDFATGDIGVLFRQMLVPALLGMVSIVLVNLADGAFVGHGAGTDALAAVNIAAPIFNIMTGIGIMFGIGASVISSILLSRNESESADYNISHALAGSFILASLISALIIFNLDTTCRLFGSSEALVPLAGSYLFWIALSMPFNMMGMVGEFVIRLDGSPKYAMCCTLVGTILNTFLDWLFIFPFGWGLEGAAKATALSFMVSPVFVIVYMVFLAKDIHFRMDAFAPDKLSLALRNLYEQAKAGFSGMLGEIAISGAMIVGNFVFIAYLGEDGVAAYSVACYLMPVIFMLIGAITQSSQPIISFAYGAGDSQRLYEARNISVRGAVVVGLFSSFLLSFCAPVVTLLFIDSSQNAYTLCVEGMPYFGISGILISLNLVIIGYLQSVERSAQASFFTLLRGFVFVIPAFIFLPRFLGTAGIWLAIPVAEFLTLTIALTFYIKRRL